MKLSRERRTGNDLFRHFRITHTLHCTIPEFVPPEKSLDPKPVHDAGATRLMWDGELESVDDVGRTMGGLLVPSYSA